MLQQEVKNVLEEESRRNGHGESPNEERLRRENSQLIERVQVLERRIRREARQVEHLGHPRLATRIIAMLDRTPGRP